MGEWKQIKINNTKKSAVKPVWKGEPTIKRLQILIFLLRSCNCIRWRHDTADIARGKDRERRKRIKICQKNNTTKPNELEHGIVE